MVLEQAAFGVTAAFGIIMLVMMMHAKDIMHSAIFLGLFFTATSFMFGLMGASLLGIIQFLVFAGGIIILIIIAVMLGGSKLEAEKPSPKMFAVSIVFLLSIFVALNRFPMNGPVKTFELAQISAAFSQFGFLAVISSMVLFSSLVAAIYLLKGDE